MKKIDIKSVLIGLLIGTNLMFLIGAKQQPDDIVAKSITIINDDGKESVIISSVKGHGAIGTYNADGKETLYVGTNKYGHGLLQTYNADGKMNGIFGSNEDGNGNLQTNNFDGNVTTSLGTSDTGDGNLQTFGTDGKITAYLGTNRNGDGLLEILNKYGNRVGIMSVHKDDLDGFLILNDRYGDLGWAKRGKK